jgi:hypothetical protein
MGTHSVSHYLTMGGIYFGHGHGHAAHSIKTFSKAPIIIYCYQDPRINYTLIMPSTHQPISRKFSRKAEEPRLNFVNLLRSVLSPPFRHPLLSVLKSTKHHQVTYELGHLRLRCIKTQYKTLICLRGT